jgi:16S rRNA (cytidine1402-2'-O)-methyltransferase
MEGKKGELFLLPNVLNAELGPLELVLPGAVLSRMALLRHFVVEGEKAAWRLLSKVMDRPSLAEVSMEILDEHTPVTALAGLLGPALAGQDLGLLSEAGLPCIADPGGALVAAAHEAGIVVRPLTGPSSLLLALAASGLDGQRFSFLGYLPQERAARRAALQTLERGLRADGATRLFIETPYRNDRLLEDCLEILQPETRLCVASGLTTERERVRQASVASWRRLAGRGASAIGKEPAIFLVGRVPGTSPEQGRPSSRSEGPCRNKRR